MPVATPTSVRLICVTCLFDVATVSAFLCVLAAHSCVCVCAIWVGCDSDYCVFVTTSGGFDGTSNVLAGNLFGIRVCMRACARVCEDAA